MGGLYPGSVPTFDPGEVFSWVQLLGWWGKLINDTTVVVTQEHNARPLHVAKVLFHDLYRSGGFFEVEMWIGRRVRISSCRLEAESVTVTLELEPLDRGA